MSIYERFGVTPMINAAGTKTRLGGVRMPREVIDAMAEAAEMSVDMADLQAAASRVIAGVTGAEAGYVTSGAAAGLTLGAAACLSGTDPGRIDRLPCTDGMANEIVIPRAHRNSYDHAWRAAGARLVEVGFDDRAVGSGMRSLDAWELEAAIGPSTVAVAYVANRRNDPPLDEVVAVAHRHGLPVLVDAAAQLPPVSNLTAFIASGADLVSFSGGKAIRGPQSTGLLCGRKELICAVLLNHLDMDLLAPHWSPPRELFGEHESIDLPRHGIGRGFKVSKENVIGFLVALERFVQEPWQRAAAQTGRIVDTLSSVAREVPGVHTQENPAYGIPRLELHFEAAHHAASVLHALERGTPAIAVDPAGVASGVLGVDTIGLSEADADLVAGRLREVLMELEPPGSAQRSPSGSSGAG